MKGGESVRVPLLSSFPFYSHLHLYYLLPITYLLPRHLTTSHRESCPTIAPLLSTSPSPSLALVEHPSPTSFPSSPVRVTPRGDNPASNRQINAAYPSPPSAYPVPPLKPQPLGTSPSVEAACPAPWDPLQPKTPSLMTPRAPHPVPLPAHPGLEEYPLAHKHSVKLVPEA